MSTLKPCYVRLNRNFPIGSLKINNYPMVENSEYFCGGIIAPLDASNRKNHKLRKMKKVEYIDESENSCDGTSESEWDEDDSASADGETNEEKVGKRKKQKLSKTEEPKKRTCLSCDKSFSSHSTYLIHNCTHQSKQFKCVLCMKNHKDRQSFVNHMKRYHPEVEPFVCDYRHCQQSFKTGKLLKLHSKFHFRYMCRFCKQLFVKKKIMRRHVLKFH